MSGGRFASTRGALLAGGFALCAAAALAQDPGPQRGPSAIPTDREAATHDFLGLGVVPDKDAAAKGKPLFQQNCAFCHGPEGRGATGPSLIVSDVVLDDDHGEKLVPFLKGGRPEKGMPAFAGLGDEPLRQIAEFLHLEVEEIANRGTYKVLNILVGDKVKGKDYVAANCMSCHNDATFAGIGGKFRSPDLLQRGWVWPNRRADHSTDVTATVKLADGSSVAGRVTMVSDFRIALVDSAGKAQVIERGPGVEVQLKDPLAPHQAMIMTLKNQDMWNVTAYLDSLK
jgi:mono/diheme cytochrome c family protein